MVSNKHYMGEVDQTLFIKREKRVIIFFQIYINDIVFASSSYKIVEIFVKLMRLELEMSLVGELSYFLGLETKQPRKILSSLKLCMLEILSIILNPLM